MRIWYFKRELNLGLYSAYTHLMMCVKIQDGLLSERFSYPKDVFEATYFFLCTGKNRLNLQRSLLIR